MKTRGFMFAAIAVALVLAASLTAPALAQDSVSGNEMRAPLAVGDEAPPLSIDRWASGPPVDTANPETPYVVVFHITACPSCRKSLPYLGELSQAYRQDLPIVNVFAHELPVPNDLEGLASMEKVRSLLEAVGGATDMSVGVDGPGREMGDQWGIYAFPSAYLVIDGEIAWTGDPTWLEPVLEQVRAGTFDPEAALKQQEAYDAKKGAARTAAMEEDFEGALAIAEELIAGHPDESSLYFMKYQILLDSGRQEAADGFLEQLIEADPERFDWDHLVPMTYLFPEEPNFALSLRTADKAIARAKWDLAVASLLSWKAKIYLARYDAQQPDDKRDIEKAAEALKEALAISEAEGDILDRRRYEAELAFLQFRQWAGVDDEIASNFLKSVLTKEAPRVNWVRYVEDGLRYQETPDYGLLLWSADRAYAEAFDETMEAEALASKGAVYAAMANYSDAISLYEEAVSKVRFAANQDALADYEEALSSLREKL